MRFDSLTGNMRRVRAVFKPSLDSINESSQKKFVWNDQILVFVRRSVDTERFSSCAILLCHIGEGLDHDPDLQTLNGVPYQLRLI